MYTQLEQRSMAVPPVNVASLMKMKNDGEAIACITAYDASFALAVDQAGISRS
jgi:3-methyl-2-oxobutanoate hydroxymethyltransferase